MKNKPMTNGSFSLEGISSAILTISQIASASFSDFLDESG